MEIPQAADQRGPSVCPADTPVHNSMDHMHRSSRGAGSDLEIGEEDQEKMSRVLPILFNTDMTESILDRCKTATRRKIDSDIVNSFDVESDGKAVVSYIDKATGDRRNPITLCQYQPGDILYVRETWAFWPCIECENLNGESCKLYKAPETHEDKDTVSEGCYIYRAGHPRPDRITWRPSIHMPKAAARIWLRVTDVKIQRLQDMNLDDFLREGVQIRPEAYNDPENAYTQAREIFAGIWDSTLRGSDKDKFGWPANPWVWVIGFEQIEKP